MKHLAVALFCFFAVPSLSQAQTGPQPAHSALLDHFQGHWVLRYTFHGKMEVHDVTGSSALEHHYMLLHEVSREKNADGTPQYEAFVYITREAARHLDEVAWLDVFGGDLPPSLGFGQETANRVRFLFDDPSGSVDFVNDMHYDHATDSWTWIMDNVDHGKHIPFARMRLTRS